MLIFLIILAVAIIIICFVRHQRSLRLRATLMQEAINNRDFTFRLPTNGLLSGERALQEALNQLGEIVRQQVNRNEVETWEKLTRVLTHEMMNSTAPIISISQSLLKREDVKGTPIEEGIRTIFHTTSHLNEFVDNYRKLSLPISSSTEKTTLSQLHTDLQQLFPQLEISLQTTAPDAQLSASTSQVFINLIKNAVEANAHRVAIRAEQQDQQLQIRVSNDGTPIPAEARSSIFIPFFTTKRSGNGIGLSLCRRILIQQGGSLELLDQPETSFHTTFEIHVKTM